MYTAAVVQDREAWQPSDTLRLQARERVLRQAVEDLTAEIRDLKAQRDAISEAYERLRGAPAVTPAGAIRGIGPPPRKTGPAAALRGVGKRAILGTLGALRRVWRVADPAQRFVVDLRAAADPALALPTLTVVVEAAPGASRGVDRLAELARQTAERLEVAVWDRGRGKLELRSAHGDEPRRANSASRDELLAAVSGDYVATLPEGAHSLPTTLFEALQWLLSSEHLAYVRVLASPTEDDGDPAPGLLLCRREIWQPDGVDLEGLAVAAARQAVLGKTVGLAGRLDAAVPRLATLGPGSGRVVCRTGRYDVWAGNRAGPVLHQLRPLHPDPEAGIRGRPAVLVLAAAPIEGGAAGVLAATVRELRDAVRVVVAATAADHALAVTRALQLEQLGATVYELGSTLHPEIWPSAVDRIAGRLDPQAVLVVGRDSRLDGAIGRLRAGGARIVALPVGSCASFAGSDFQLVADSTQGTVEDEDSGGERRVPVPVGWLLPGARPELSAQLRERVRAELGVPAGCWLVVTVADLVADARPEDVVVVADRLRQEAGLALVLVGDGPLAGNVRDLMSFLGVDALQLRQPHQPLEELVAAADVVLDPSHEPIVRPLVAAALAAGTPVVTAPGGGAEGLIAEIGGGVVVGSVGDPDQLAAAVRRVRVSGLRPSGERARTVLARQRKAGADAIRRALLGGAIATSGG